MLRGVLASPDASSSSCTHARAWIHHPRVCVQVRDADVQQVAKVNAACGSYYNASVAGSLRLNASQLVAPVVVLAHARQVSREDCAHTHTVRVRAHLSTLPDTVVPAAGAPPRRNHAACTPTRCTQALEQRPGQRCTLSMATTSPRCCLRLAWARQQACKSSAWRVMTQRAPAPGTRTAICPPITRSSCSFSSSACRRHASSSLKRTCRWEGLKHAACGVDALPRRRPSICRLPYDATTAAMPYCAVLCCIVLQVAPDFFSYFAATAPLLDEDSSLYCISAWNDHGQAGRASNATALYRTDGECLSCCDCCC